MKLTKFELKADKLLEISILSNRVYDLGDFLERILTHYPEYLTRGEINHLKRTKILIGSIWVRLRRRQEKLIKRY
jgi:hypothetical protein